MKTHILTGLGFIFLLLGAIGLLLPVWPTTPFVLVSAVCFSSNPHLKARIMKIGFFKEYIQNYESRRGLSTKTFLISICWLWGMLLLSILLTRTLWIVLVLLVVGILVTCHLIWMTKSKEGNGNK